MQKAKISMDHSFINLFRAVAAFWVLAAHCMIWGGWYHIPLPSAKIAVDLFMMISGYLMAASVGARAKTEPLTKSQSWLRFWLRRFFRIAPAYYLSLLLAVVFSDSFLGGYKLLQGLNPSYWMVGGVYDPARIEYTPLIILSHLSFLFGLDPKLSFSSFLPDWSLGLEMQFYFIFPALMLLMQKQGFLKISFLVSVFSIPIGFYIAKHVQYYEPSLLLFKLQYFIAGILAFKIVLRGESRNQILMIACATILVSLESGYGHELFVLPFLLLAIILFGHLERNHIAPNMLIKFINSHFIKFSSDASYGVYLFHGFYISACGYIFTKNSYFLSYTPFERVGAMFFFVTTLAYITGYGVHRWVEIPGINLGRTISNQLFSRELRKLT
jgi:peptidoglycan/LPS O-acetylase OafA/YrhL